ncbi:MAG: fibrobacter succinogenes major paralogous domain-containing protein [Bacteroidales bacterium]|jgi:uncharacterized protein (TIGR02145 family)|nr:fibrobacter succinogenes major paralogous domain-containing protein [Bacteroidales bacterium]MDD4385573.1 fibrobacter succinogenes major paralogous domain-containing protein [Bacteroidales bacterium]MDY0198934.1 fibrobacter succinogenes major paralogous domain-containing protein [Tenuifilaceae bacterium]
MIKKTSFLLYALILGLLVLSSGCKKDDDNEPEEIVIDADGNVYKTVTIGNQTWMAENLKTTKYNDGSGIPLDEVWNIPANPAYCWYDNDQATNGKTYGALYNFSAVNTKKLCPTGWHVPTNAEWTELINFLEGEDVAGGKLKETGTAHWTSPNVGATDEFGFTALPGGSRRWSGVAANIKVHGNWWTSSVLESGTPFYLNLNHETSVIKKYVGSVENGFSIRCIKEDLNLPVLTTTEVTQITPTTAVSGGDITNDGVSPVKARGVCWSTNETPTINDNKTADGEGKGIFISEMKGLVKKTTYYVRAYASNSKGTSYGEIIKFTTPEDVKDASGNVYSTVKIGTQTWMAENLKTTKYKDGTAITLDEEWYNDNTPIYCWYDNDETANKDTYGALYTWYVVNTGKICPTGWHVPTNDDWATLTAYLGGSAVAGGKLKEVGTTHWLSPNTGATNASGFTALPGGIITRMTGFGFLGTDAVWWSATDDSSDSSQAYMQGMTNEDAMIIEQTNPKKMGSSIRCVKN